MSSGYSNSNLTRWKSTPSNPANSNPRSNSMSISRSSSPDFTLSRDRASHRLLLRMRTTSHQTLSNSRIIIERGRIIRQWGRWGRRSWSRSNSRTGGKPWINKTFRTSLVLVIRRINRHCCKNRCKRFPINTCKMWRIMMINLSLRWRIKVVLRKGMSMRSRKKVMALQRELISWKDLKISKMKRKSLKISFKSNKSHNLIQ